MTRARALKQVIRARAAKTGERYTTARRHILKELNDHDDRAPVAQRVRCRLTHIETLRAGTPNTSIFRQKLPQTGAKQPG